jgi:hypothetical protein
MRRKIGALAVLITLALAGCASDERQWMKLNEKYTVQDFRRDTDACTKGGKLDDTCLRAKGWVDVGPTKGEKPPDPYGRDPRPNRGRLPSGTAPGGPGPGY